MSISPNPGALRATRYATKPSACVVAVFLALLFTTTALAGSATYGDVTVNLDPPPGDSSNYGYAVYRLTVTNRGPAARTVTVTLPASSYGGGDHLRGLTKTLRVGPNATAAADLTQPAVPLTGNAARVAIDGSAQRDLLPVDLVDHDAYGEGDLILVGRGVPEAVRVSLLDGLNAWQERIDNAGSTSGFGGGYGVQPVPELIRADRPATEFSDNWLFYSRYLAVMLGEAEARQLSPPAAAALRDYVAAGGIVMLIGGGNKTAELPDGWRGAWTRELGFALPDITRVAYGMGQLFFTDADSLSRVDTELLEAVLEAWREITSDRRVVVGAEGAESRLPMLENIAVPVRGLLILMLVFTLVIGPANLMVLHWLNRRMWLLWTIPVIAFTFAGAVLVYSLLSEGISPRARSVAVTLLDQTTRRAVTVGAIGYYAPLTPGGGLTFGEQTLVAPQYGNEDYGYGYSNSGRPRTLDLTNGQHLASGWIVARVPAHFTLRKPETMRERLDISRDPETGGLRVVNGLGKPIRVLHLMDADGRGYVVDGLAPGASAVAVQPTAGPVHEELLPLSDAFNTFGAWGTATLLGGQPPRYHLEPSTYLAVLDNATFLEPGLDDLTDHEATGVVVGYWGEGE